MLTTTTACLIDDEGQAWDAASSAAAERLRARFAIAGETRVTAPYGPRTSGCLWIERTPRLVRIIFNPETVRPAALARADALLRKARPGFASQTAFCLCLIDSRTSDVLVSEIYASLDQCLNRLKFLIGENGADGDPSYADRFDAKMLTLALARKTPPLERLLEFWHVQQGVVDVEAILPVWRSELEDRFTLLEKMPQQRGYAIIEIGKALRISWHAFVPRLNGAGLLGMPDARYARWASEPFDGILASGRPIFQQVTALMFWPDTGFVERRYRRLLVPWIDTAGRRLILSVNRPLPGE